MSFNSKWFDPSWYVVLAFFIPHICYFLTYINVMSCAPRCYVKIFIRMSCSPILMFYHLIPSCKKACVIYPDNQILKTRCLETVIMYFWQLVVNYISKVRTLATRTTFLESHKHLQFQDGLFFHIYFYRQGSNSFQLIRQLNFWRYLLLCILYKHTREFVSVVVL